MSQRHIFNNSTPYVAQSELSDIEPIQLIAKAKEELKTREEFIYFLTHKINNKRHKNGRICMEYDTNTGLLYANSVSPYSKDFSLNIEENIKDLVKAFTDKRYLTYSSCEGHGKTFRRYVGLAFANEESRNYVYQYILSLKIPGVYCIKKQSVINQTLSITNLGEINYISKQQNQIKRQEVDTFNIQFHRNYSDFFFLEIIILKEVPFGTFWKKPIRNSFNYFSKKYLWNILTKLLTKKIKSNDFQKYLY